MRLAYFPVVTVNYYDQKWYSNLIHRSISQPSINLTDCFLKRSVSYVVLFSLVMQYRSINLICIDILNELTSYVVQQ